MLWSKWFTGIRDKIYAAQVKEDVPLGFRSQVFVMRVTGIWPTTNDSPWYKWLTIGFFFIVGFLAPLTLFVNVFYSNNIQEAIEHSFVALNFWATAIKAGVSLWRRNNLRHIFRIQANLMNASGSNVQRNDQVARMNYLVHIGFTVLYCSTMSGAVIQATLSKPEDAIFPSTAPLPYGFARRRSVYLAVLVYQILGGYGIIIWAGIKDSLFFAFINTVCGHVAQLKERLQSLGTDGDDMTFYRDLVECCKCYEDCIRSLIDFWSVESQLIFFSSSLILHAVISFAKSMDNILSLAFFAQFGSSSLVICSTVYLLSVVRNSYTFHTIMCCRQLIGRFIRFFIAELSNG